ncbi:MAG TPA: hypothetical protein VIJ93_12090 [bacterium]
MRKLKLVSFLVLSLVLSVALPALTMGQSAPPAQASGGNSSGGKGTPVPTSTPTPVIGDDDGDEDAVGCLGVLDFLGDCGGCHHHHYSRFGGREGCGRD